MWHPIKDQKEYLLSQCYYHGTREDKEEEATECQQIQMNYQEGLSTSCKFYDLEPYDKPMKAMIKQVNQINLRKNISLS